MTRALLQDDVSQQRIGFRVWGNYFTRAPSPAPACAEVTPSTWGTGWDPPDNPVTRLPGLVLISALDVAAERTVPSQ
jgi:hypothetical protein